VFSVKKFDVAQELAGVASMAIAANGVLRIGAWRVDPALDEISRDGTTLKLEPRAMQVLVCLAERAGEVVSVDQLLDAVWKDVVVTSDSVYQAVAGLRRALGDDTKEPIYIANVLRRGYRLVAPVTSVASGNPSFDKPATEPAEIPVAPMPATARSRGWSWVVLVVVAVSAIGYSVAEKLWWSKQTLPVGHEPTALTVGPGEPSVAVLPFVDMSDEKDQEYFADGLSGVLIDRLAMVPGLHVPGRTSSIYFKGKQAPVSEIAKALGVANLLEGTVRKSGNTLRVTARLERGNNGYQVWSQTFDGPLTDIFKIQDEIADAVVQVLKLSILDHYLPEAVRTTSIEAYALYFRAQSNMVSGGLADYDAAIQRLHAALKLDPRFAGAWANLALVTTWQFDMRGSPNPTMCTDARAAADRALELDSTLIEAHRAKGTVLHYCDGNLSAAEVEFRRALELQPRSSDALRSYAWLALSDRRPDQALQLAQRAVSLDPLNAWNFVVLGSVHWSVSRLPEAEAAYRKALEVNSTAAGVHGLLANILISAQKTTEAIAEAEREPEAEWRAMVLPFALLEAGRRSDADRAIAQYESEYAADPEGIAAYYACRHDTERAIRWLTSFARSRAGEYRDLPNREACFRNVESDARYQTLERQMENRVFCTWTSSGFKWCAVSRPAASK
jgi:transcriptional activator of cad operon